MKRALEWVLWTPTNAAITVFGGLGLLMAALMLFGGASNTSAAPAPSATSTATQTGIVVPVPEITAAPLPPLPNPSISTAVPTLPGDSAGDRSTPEGVANAFMETWLQIRALDREQWEAELIRLTPGTGPMADQIRAMDPSMIPAAQILLSAQTAGTERQASVEVSITNGETYYVELTRDDEGVWQVVSADTYGGDPARDHEGNS